MAAPNHVATYETAWNTSTTPKSVSVTTAVGDRLVCVGGTANGGGSLGTPTGGTSLTWSNPVALNGGTGNCDAYIWTATASTAETFTCQVASSGTVDAWGFAVVRYDGSDGFGASNSTTRSTTQLQEIALTTTQDDSAIVIGLFDWEALNSAVTWNTSAATPTEIEAQYVAGNYGAYAARYPGVGTAGSKTVGLATPTTGMACSIGVIEILGSSGNAGVTAVPATTSSVLAHPPTVLVSYGLTIAATRNQTGV